MIVSHSLQYTSCKLLYRQLYEVLLRSSNTEHNPLPPKTPGRNHESAYYYLLFTRILYFVYCIGVLVFSDADMFSCWLHCRVSTPKFPKFTPVCLDERSAGLSKYCTLFTK